MQARKTDLDCRRKHSVPTSACTLFLFIPLLDTAVDEALEFVILFYCVLIWKIMDKRNVFVRYSDIKNCPDGR